MTDDDIVRARLKTVGIQEHRLVFKDGPWNNRLCTLFYFILSHLYYPIFITPWQTIDTMDGSGVFMM